MKKVAVVLLLVCGVGVAAQEKGLVRKVKDLAGEYAVVGRQYAVLIAIDRYEHWLPLKNPVKDGKLYSCIN